MYSLRWIAILLSISTIHGQMLINGRTFTNGLSIINSPFPNTRFNTGATLPISIEVSGNGRLPSAAVASASGLPTHFSMLEIYLVSSETQVNVTVSAEPSFLVREKGSVRHLDRVVPSCVPSGLFNLTFYESGQFNNLQYFTITAIPIEVRSNVPTTQCPADSNQLLPQPQPSSPLDQSPFVPGYQTLVYTKAPVSSQSASFDRPISNVASTVPPTTIVQTLTATVVTTAGLVTPPAVTNRPDDSSFFPVNSSPRTCLWSIRGLCILVICIYML